MQLLVEQPVGKHPKGSIVTESDFSTDRIKELQKMGILTPWSGTLAVPSDPEDLDGWKRHAEALRKENKALRTASPESETLAAKMDLEIQVRGLTAQLSQVQNELAQLTLGTVTKAAHQNVCDQLTQLQHLHKSTVAELELKKK